MITHINTVAVYVDDQQKSLEFWTEKVGFQVRRKEQMGPNAFWLEVGPENAQTCVVLYPQVDDGQLGRAKAIYCL